MIYLMLSLNQTVLIIWLVAQKGPEGVGTPVVLLVSDKEELLPISTPVFACCSNPNITVFKDVLCLDWSI